MFLLIPINSVGISIYVYYSNIPTQAIVVIRSKTYMLTLYCVINVYVYGADNRIYLDIFLTKITYPNNR